MPFAVQKDDLIHKPEKNKDWRESYYFDFYDEKQGFGIWSSIGKKPYKGYSGFTIGIWGGEKVYCGVGRDRFKEYNEEHIVEGLQYECIIPNEKWRITFDGKLSEIDKELRISPDVFSPLRKDNFPQVPVEFDLIFTNTSPCYQYYGNDDWKNLFTGHLDQTGRTTGTIKINNKSYQIDGLGARDRSWGIRNWVWPMKWRYVHLPSDEMNIMLWYAKGENGNVIIDGFYQDESNFESIIDFSEELISDYVDPKPITTSFKIHLKTSKERNITLKGTILQITPVVFSKEENGQMVKSWNDRSLVRYELPSGKIAYGNIEFSERLHGAKNY
jgi:hypothetical protein